MVTTRNQDQFYKSSSIDHSRLTSSARGYSCTDVDGQTHRTSGQYKDHEEAISCFIGEVQDTHARLELLLRKNPEFGMCAEVLSLRLYFNIQSVRLDQNPFAYYLIVLREGTS